MNQTIYTVIVYTPGEQGYHERCGDYHYGKDSDMKTHSFIDLQSTGVFMGETKFNNNDVELTILVNGLNEDEYNDFLTNDEQFDLEKVCEQIRDISKIKFDELTAIKLAQDEADKLKKSQEMEFIGRREKERLEQAERAQLAQLQAKYGK